LSSFEYFLKNSSSDISIDSTTGSIILLTKLNRDRLQYEIIAIDSSNQKTLTDVLIINDHGSLFEKENYQINIRKSLPPGTIINDDDIYFNLKNIHQCWIDEKKLNGTKICTIGKDSIDFIYQLIDPVNLFDILPNNGTILNRKIFNYKIDEHEFNVTIVVRDRKNQVLKIFETSHRREEMDFKRLLRSTISDF
jgi:hypothetical protein